MRYRKAASFLLIAALPEVLLQCRGVGHGEGGAVDMPGAMTFPEILLLCLRRLLGSATDALSHFLHALQRQTSFGGAISRRRHLLSALADQFGIGDIARQHLLGQ